MTSTIQRRICEVRDAIKHESHERWWQFIIDNPELPWNWNMISRNPNLTMNFINDNPDKPWNWNMISYNPNLTMNFINKYPDKDWCWYEISKNPFTKEKENFQMKRYRKHLAAILIHNAYKNALVDPNCQLGLNRIERDMVFAGVKL